MFHQMKLFQGFWKAQPFGLGTLLLPLCASRLTSYECFSLFSLGYAGLEMFHSVWTSYL